MAPFVQESTVIDSIPKAKSQPERVALDHDNVQKPVADDFMYDFKYNHGLPTTDILGIEIPTDCDAQKEASDIVTSLSKATTEEDAQAFAGLFLDYGQILH